MLALYAARKTHDCAAGIHIPIRCAKSRKRRDKINPVGVRHAFRQFVTASCGINQPQIVAQPFNHRTRVKRRALNRIFHAVAEAPSYAGHQIVFRLHTFFAGVHQQETAGAVSIFRLTRFKAALPEQRGGLVADRARNRYADNIFKAQKTGRDFAVDCARGNRFRQNVHRNPEPVTEIFVPAKLIHVKKHRARSVGIVGDMYFAAG